MTVLIMTHSRDNDCVETVAREIERRGHRAARCDTDLFPTGVRLATRQGARRESYSLSLGDGSETVDLGALEAIWNRRYYLGRAIPESLDPQLRRPAVDEARASFFGTVACLETFQLDRLLYSHYARHKPWQLQLALRLGLDVPDTLTTNDPAAVRDFARRHGGAIVGKMMTSFAVYDDQGHESVVFTNPIGDRDLEDLGGLDLSPMTFQENVPKDLELRVTVVGRRIFAAAIDSQSSERAAHDWRRDGGALVDRWQPYELPAELERRLFALCDRLCLNYGAIDLIRTPDGRHVFLEINPVGEFFWLEIHPGFPISETLAAVLTDPGARRLP